VASVVTESKNLNTELAAMFAGEEQDEDRAYDMRKIVLAEKDKLKKKKKSIITPMIFCTIVNVLYCCYFINNAEIKKSKTRFRLKMLELITLH
jgi:hypothetical protein